MAEAKLTAAQQAVVDNRGGTILVSAAAGSGKTKVLVDRVMKKIQHEGKNINEFLIITFTIAAAAELKAKISAAIRKALSQNPGNMHLQRQMNLIHLAQISTVHSFCSSVLRQYGYQKEIPSDFTMLEDPHREEMLTELLEDILEEQYTDMTPEFRRLVDTLGAGRSDQSLEDLVKSVFEKLLSEPNPLSWLKERKAEVYISEELSATKWAQILISDAKIQLGWIIERYEDVISEIEADDAFNEKYLAAYRMQKYCYENMLSAMDGPWDEIAPKLVLEKTTERAPSKYPDTVKLDAIKAVKKDGTELLKKLNSRFSVPESRLIEDQNYMADALNALLSVAELLYTRFEKEKRRKNYMDFSDLEHLTIQLLIDEEGNPTAVARELSESFCEIMVDEYQDSNSVQEMIYRAISAAGDKNRFLVGDVKQSIYGFRQAEPQLFLEKYLTYPSVEAAREGQPRKLILSQNFRSRPDILAAANHVFETVMSPQVGGLSYGAEERLYPGLGDNYPQDGQIHVELDVLSLTKRDTARDDDSTKYQREAAWVAGRIVTLLQENTPVRDGETLRPARPEDIAILFRSKSAMGVFRKALNRAGVPVFSGEGEALFDYPEAQVLLNFLRVIDNPHQDVPLLSVLCSPLFRFSNDQLAEIRLAAKQELLYDAMLTLETEWTNPAIQMISDLRKASRAMSAEKIVWKILYDYGLLTTYSAMENGRDKQEHLLFLYELARKTAADSHLYLYDLIRMLERSEESGLTVPGHSGSGVVLTTIHKSKGLEYPIVFLCDLSRGFNFRELNDTVLVDGALGISAKIVDPMQRVRYPGISFEAMKLRKYENLLSEELRVLYVAMTRPKDYLFMTYADTVTKSGNRFLSRLYPGAGKPAKPWAARDAKCLGDWVLLSALSLTDAGAFFADCGYPRCERKMAEYPWRISLISLDTVEIPAYSGAMDVGDTTETGEIPVPEKLRQALTWEYPHALAARTPSKLTATQLKGRQKDEEIAEHTVQQARVHPLKSPEFLMKKQGLTEAEQGTAAHLFLQYADFTKLSDLHGVMAELDRLVDEAYILEEQADAVSPEMMLQFFQSELGQKLKTGEHIIREFKFSLLTDASEYYPGISEEQVLLQGVVDAAILEEDGITVIDFKTDRVTEKSVMQRAEQYRGQLITYKKVLERILKKPVKRTILYFLRIGKEVVL